MENPKCPNCGHEIDNQLDSLLAELSDNSHLEKLLAELSDNSHLEKLLAELHVDTVTILSDNKKPS